MESPATEDDTALRAANLIIERSYGKAPQKVEVENYDVMTDAELDRTVANAIARLKAIGAERALVESVGGKGAKVRTHQPAALCNLDQPPQHERSASQARRKFPVIQGRCGCQASFGGSRSNCPAPATGRIQCSRRMIQPSRVGVRSPGAASKAPSMTSAPSAERWNSREPQVGQKLRPLKVRVSPVKLKRSAAQSA